MMRKELKKRNSFGFNCNHILTSRNTNSPFGLIPKRQQPGADAHSCVDAVAVEQVLVMLAFYALVSLRLRKPRTGVAVGASTPACLFVGRRLAKQTLKRDAARANMLAWHVIVCHSFWTRSNVKTAPLVKDLVEAATSALLVQPISSIKKFSVWVVRFWCGLLSHFALGAPVHRCAARARANGIGIGRGGSHNIIATVAGQPRLAPWPYLPSVSGAFRANAGARAVDNAAATFAKRRWWGALHVCFRCFVAHTAVLHARPSLFLVTNGDQPCSAAHVG